MKVFRYRPNAAALILDAKGKLLICERLDQPGSWQFPQGGVDTGETLKKGLFREVQEEVGFFSDQYKIKRIMGPYYYLYPPKIMIRKLASHGYHGQAQTYFLLQMKEKKPPPRFE